jgi:hypothetical protein
MDKCGAGWKSRDGKQIFECDRDSGRHIVHRNSEAGMKCIRVPGGALISDTK